MCVRVCPSLSTAMFPVRRHAFPTQAPSIQKTIKKKGGVSWIKANLHRNAHHKNRASRTTRIPSWQSKLAQSSILTSLPLDPAALSRFFKR